MRRLPILVIEEDADLAQYLARLVDEIGYRPFVANSVGDALRSIARRGYVLILSNYFGPREQFLYRWPILRLIADFAPQTPVLAVSALKEVPTGKNVVGVVPWPFSENEFAQLVRRYALSRPKRPRDPLLARYLAALWDADAGESAKVVAEAMAAGWSAKAIYEDLFTAALYEIGDWWGADSCTVADEHGARAITERLMATVAAGVKNQPAKARRILVACMAGERHELGARMVADLFTWDGWTVRFLGADTPEAEIVAEARRRQADAVGLSAAIRLSLADVRSQIDALREAGVGLVVLGGQAFREMNHDAIVGLGADGKADKARDGVELVNRLVAEKEHS